MFRPLRLSGCPGIRTLLSLSLVLTLFSVLSLSAHSQTTAAPTPVSASATTSSGASSSRPRATTTTTPARPGATRPASSTSTTSAATAATPSAPASTTPSSASASAASSKSSLGVVHPQAIYQATTIAVPPFAVQPQVALDIETIPRVLRNDFQLSGYFKVAPPEVVNSQNLSDVSRRQVNFTRWQQLKVQHYIMGSCAPGSAPGSVQVDVILYDINSQNLVFNRRFEGTVTNYRDLAHRISDEVIKYLKGFEGIARTRIAYVVTQGSPRIKELAVMDYDGFGQTNAPLTSHRNLVTGPTWGALGKEIYFTSYRDYNPDLFGIQPGTGKEWIISRRPGLNALADWNQATGRLALILSQDGNNELYTCDRTGAGLKRLTKSRTIESSPSWSPDGSRIAFVSDRDTGLPQVFIMNADGSGVRRLTTLGSYNDAPAWSPKGDRIAFVGRDRGHFDIFTINADGTGVRRLTEGQGDNETPSWAPDGRHVCFSSNRTGTWQIWISLDDGSNQQRITLNDGANHTQPSWSPQAP